MIDFGCRQFRLDEIIKCGLSLTKKEYEIFMHIMSHPDVEYTTIALSKKLKLSLTAIQKAVKKLSEKRVIDKKQKNLSNGGYTFIYRASVKNDVRNELKAIIERWTEKAKLEIDRLS